METKNCQNCKKEFSIEENDFSFYQKAKVPLPTWCPPCRMTRRLAFGNAWGVHFRNCAKCDKKTLAMYRHEDSTVVYCDPCWWADNWDGTEYAMDYDPSRSFLEQWQELRMRTPHFAKDALYQTLKNCEYTNSIAFSKNCYLTFWADYCDNTYYSAFLNEVKDCVDVFRSLKSELCYQSVGVGFCNRTMFSSECDSCVDVWFSRNCYGCMNCVGCVNQRNKNYMIFNQQYSREEYFVKLKELKLDTRSGINNVMCTAQELWKNLPYREYTGNPQNLNVTGDYIYESKNAKSCYMATSVEDSKYCQFVSVPKTVNCMDYYGWGNGAELVYETATSGEDISNIKFCFGIFGSGQNEEYCGFTVGGANNFGCVNLKRKKYCILNKEYSKEEYETLRAKIIEDMDKNTYTDKVGRIYKYGEFFPPEFSPFPYNDSNAYKFITKSKDQSLREGYKWKDNEERLYECTVKGTDLPETITEITDKILKEIIECTECEKGFKFTNGEIDIYRKLNIPVPDQCHKCRETTRFSMINMPLNTFATTCSKCKKEIETKYKKEDNKIIYCVKCYQEEAS